MLNSYCVRSILAGNVHLAGQHNDLRPSDATISEQYLAIDIDSINADCGSIFSLVYSHKQAQFFVAQIRRSNLIRKLTQNQNGWCVNWTVESCNYY